MSGFLSLLGWSFLPSLVTKWVQFIYYGLAIRAGDPKPRPGSPRHTAHRRRIYILVVTAYLLYTIYEADYELQRRGTFFSDLDVPLAATEKEIKSRYRRLAALHHPDKVSGTDAAAANAYFVHLQRASDTLTNPAKRFAYERFGESAITWQHCTTVKDYIVRGVQMLALYYGAVAGAIYVLDLFGYLNFGLYERWLVLVALLVFEVHTVTRPGIPALLERAVNPLLAWLSSSSFGFVAARPPYVSFQAIVLARKLAVTLYMAFSQIGPALQAQHDPSGVLWGGNEETVLKESVDRLDAAVRMLDADSARLLDMEIAPFVGDPEAVHGLREKLKDWLVQNTIRADPMVRDAMGRSFKRRRDRRRGREEIDRCSA